VVGAADVAEAVKAALSAALVPAFGTAPVYVGKGPENISPADAAPYVVVYVQPPLTGGPAADPHADRTFTVQVSNVGNGYDSAARIGDTAREALLAPWAPPAGAVLAGPVDPGAGEQPTQDRNSETPLFGGYELFEMRFTPTS
jgi:hypothetical protein